MFNMFNIYLEWHRMTFFSITSYVACGFNVELIREKPNLCSTATICHQYS